MPHASFQYWFDGQATAFFEIAIVFPALRNGLTNHRLFSREVRHRFSRIFNPNPIALAVRSDPLFVRVAGDLAPQRVFLRQLGPLDVLLTLDVVRADDVPLDKLL